MKKILIATDFGPYTQHTIKYVLNLLEGTQDPCTILLVNTYMVDYLNDLDNIIPLNDELKAKSKAGLELVKNETLKLIKNKNISLETSSHFGSLYNVILNIQKKENIDLVAVGKNTDINLEAISELLKKQNCPLLITQPEEEKKLFSKRLNVGH